MKLLLAALALAAAPALAAPCDTPAHRQFDFWVGVWDVHKPDGTAVARNTITREHGGCALRERYATTGRPYEGESLSAYDAGRGIWHQTWVDTQGLVLLLQGGWRDGQMVLEGTTTGADGRSTRHRVSWRPLADGAVRFVSENVSAGAWTKNSGNSWEMRGPGIWQALGTRNGGEVFGEF